MSGTARLRRGEPIWLAGRGRARQRFPSLTGRRETDVVIVGGGMTGALVALQFAEAGIGVHVVEAALVGRGSTAASSALLLQEPDHSLGELAHRYGWKTAVRIWHLSRSAVDDFMATIRRARVRCDMERRDAVYVAANSSAVDSLKRELELRRRARLDDGWLTPGETRRLTGLAAGGAIRTGGNAQFDPYRACVGLMQAAARAGAAVFERSAVTRIAQTQHGVLVHTRAGTIDAARAIVATGYASAQFRPLVGRFEMYRTYVLATRALKQSERRETGLGRVMIWDTERPYHYARWSTDRRLILGGGDRRVRPGQRRDLQFHEATRALHRDFCELWPALADITIDRAWEGLFALTPDSLPYIGAHRRYPRHWFALGYGGNGMTFGMIAARILLEQWQGVQSADHRLFQFNRHDK